MMILHMHPAGRIRLAEQAMLPVYDETPEVFAADARALGLPALVLPEGASEAWRSEGRTVVITANGQDAGPEDWPEADAVLAAQEQLVARATIRAAEDTAARAAEGRAQQIQADAQRKAREEEEERQRLARVEADAARQAAIAEQARTREEQRAAAEAVAKRRIAPLSFRMRLSTARRRQITLTASRLLEQDQPALQTALDDLNSASVVLLDREDVREYVGLLNQLDLLTAEEEAALLADSTPEERP